MLGGFALTVVLFLLINAACFAVLGFEGVVRSAHVVSDMLARVSQGGVRGLPGWLTVAMIVSALGSMNATMLGAARIPYAMARDGLLPRWLATVSETTKAPVASVVYTSVFASVLVLTGSFEDLTSLFVFTQWLFFALGTLALFRLRRLEPELARPARVPGYPFLPGLFLLLATGLTVGAFIQRPVRSGIGLALVLAGLPVHAYWQRGRRSIPAPVER
jgi:APA family basic amino acid/polyamine antiporter